MDFSYAKSVTLAKRKEKKLSTFLIAILCATLIFLPYMFFSEGYFVFFGDFNVQQIPFYQMCHKAVKSGEISWNWLTDLGSNFIGSYSFYLLGSPFFWLTIPFPNSFVPYLMGPLLILKFGCAAFTAYLYIRRFTRTPEAARLGGLLYAFSGFSVYNIFFNHFHEPLICFPLLLLALELLITENKRGVFALTVALCAFVNYFFFFGMVVFTVIYFFVRLFSKTIKVKFSRFLIIVFEAAIGLLMSSVLLIPSMYAILGNQRLSHILIGWNGIAYSRSQIYLNILECFFFPPDLPARPVFFPGANVKWSSLGGWLPLFGTVGVFTLFINKKGHWTKRLIAICMFMALVPVLNSAFYAFNSSYYARWFYMPILIMCLATVTLFEDKKVSFKSGYKWSLGITVGVSLVIGLFPQKTDEGKIIFGLYSTDEEWTYLIRFWVACLIAVVSLAIVGILLKNRKENVKGFLKASTACVCVISVIYASFFIASGRSHSYDIKESVIDDLIEGEVYLDDDTNFRIDTYDGIDNTGMYLGLSSINAFHSVVPASITEFYNYIGIERTVASRPDTTYPAIRSLLSVKYLLNRTDGDPFIDDSGNTEMTGYKYVKTSGGYYVYENENYVPYGFSYDYYMTEDFLKGYSNENKTRMMLKAILLSDEQIKKYGDYLQNIEDLTAQNNFYSGDETAMDTVAETSSENTESSDNTSSALDSQSNAQDLDQTSEQVGEQATENSVDSSEAQTAIDTTENEITKDVMSLDLDDEALSEDASRLAKTSAVKFETTKNGFSAKVERDSRSLVFFSVPYDEGWTAYVNGEKVTIEKVNVGFMAVVVPKGESNIEFVYETPGLKTGLLVTGTSITVFLLYYLIAAVFVKKHPSTTVYPEGDKLLKKWKNEDISETVSEFENEDFEDVSKIPDKEYIELVKTELNMDNGSVKSGFTINTDAFKD